VEQNKWCLTLTKTNETKKYLFINYHLKNYLTFFSKVKKSAFKERLQEVKGRNSETSQEN
jgi:hypothetical protein